VQDKNVFGKLMELGAWLTFKPALCVITPRNPAVQEDMAKNNVSEAEFARRLIELKKYYEIGFHGHWCRKGRSAGQFKGNAAVSMEKSGFTFTFDEPGEIEKQFKEEYGFFKEYGFKPKVYSAGWWFLNETIVKLLEDYGFSLYCSIRYRYANTFGERYIPLSDMPKQQGEIFHLKPSVKILECTGIFYLNANWWTLAKDMYPLLSSSAGPLYVTVPLHDYDLIEHMNIVKENITFLSRIKNVKWENMDKIITASAVS
jgi:hypothetical protein